jgi:hypothetical protein
MDNKDFKNQFSLTSKSEYQRPRIFTLRRLILWGWASLLIVYAVIYSTSSFFQQSSAADLSTQVVIKPAIIPTPAQAKNADNLAVNSEGSRSARATSALLPTATARPTPVPGGQMYDLSPTAADIGWVSSGEDWGNHFGDSFLYAGIFKGQIYQSAFQFDLGQVPRGAPIYYASIQLTGLRADRLGQGGVWMLRFLDSEIDQDWRRHNYQNIFNASVLETLNPILRSQDLIAEKTYIYELSANQLETLETRILTDENPKASFRLEGPLVGPDNLFTWDTGYGSQSQGKKVILLLNAGPPPATPPPYSYMVVTSTPTPENVITAAAISLQMTADATRIGTATPVPQNMATATPLPDYLIIIPAPTAENPATTEALKTIATAEALTTGTPTPIPTNAVTATPVPTQTPTPTPTPIDYVLITSTPTADSILMAATLSAAATAQAQEIGTPTAMPVNWVTPIAVTATPTPVNETTAQVLDVLATAIAFTTGTPTATPSNMVTATPTSIFELIPLLFTPTATPPTPFPPAIPPSLVGKILFRSNRDGANTDYVYMFDPQTGQLGRLTDSWPYQVASIRDAWSADLRFHVLTKDAIRYQNIPNSEEEIGQREDIPALYVYDSLYNVEKQLTSFGLGIAYSGVWSPTAEKITFVSNDSADDEIWVVNGDGSQFIQLTSSNEAYNAREIGKDTFIPEINKSPSWSPDGTQIVFTSNRTRNDQLWIMNADGSDQRLLMGWDNWTPYTDWGPVWVKYLDQPPTSK